MVLFHLVHGVGYAQEDQRHNHDKHEIEEDVSQRLYPGCALPKDGTADSARHKAGEQEYSEKIILQDSVHFRYLFFFS